MTIDYQNQPHINMSAATDPDYVAGDSRRFDAPADTMDGGHGPRGVWGNPDTPPPAPKATKIRRRVAAQIANWMGSYVDAIPNTVDEKGRSRYVWKNSFDDEIAGHKWGVKTNVITGIRNREYGPLYRPTQGRTPVARRPRSDSSAAILNLRVEVDTLRDEIAGLRSTVENLGSTATAMVDFLNRISPGWRELPRQYDGSEGR